MSNLTVRQKETLDYLKDFQEQHGYAPTIMEIQEHFGFRSTATVHQKLKELQTKRKLARVKGMHRGIFLYKDEGKQK